ncbi:MAG: hypothetical protein M1830_002944 [Pleopsidium flavum]|nr:MAG: hypothetical protein M1830_002944 [Pleopsidium flavum]
MTSKADASQYDIPLEWVASKGQLGKYGDIGLISSSERLILYNQDVLYHQNKEISYQNTKIQDQNKEILQALAKFGAERDADKPSTVFVPAQATATAASVSAKSNRYFQEKPGNALSRGARAMMFKEAVSNIGGSDSSYSTETPQYKPGGTKAAQHASPESVVQNHPKGTPTKTAHVRSPITLESIDAIVEKRKRAAQRNEKNSAIISKDKLKKRYHSGRLDHDHDSENSEHLMVIAEAGKQKRRNKKVKVET